MLTPILSDVLDITVRIKEIDDSYYIVFSQNKKKFELHSSNQILSSYCLTIPFEELDERTLTLAQKTRRVNQDKLFEEMEQQNKLLEKRSLYGS